MDGVLEDSWRLGELEIGKKGKSKKWKSKEEVTYPLGVVQQRGWEECEVEQGLLKPCSRPLNRVLQISLL